MFLRNKKIFLILGFLSVVVLVGFLLYSLFFRPTHPIPTATAPKATTTGGKLPRAKTGPGQIVSEKEKQKLPLGKNEKEKQPSQVATGGLTKISALNQTASLAPTLGKNGSDVQYYNQNDGKFYRINKNGQTTPLSDKIFHDVQKITWGPKKNKAILEYPDGANIIYDFNAKKQITLPKHWQNFDFSPTGEQIVMKSIGLDPDNRWLAVSNSDGSVTRPLESLGTKEDSVYPSWSPNNQIVAMYTKGIDFNRQKVFFVGLNKENFKSITIEGRGFQPKWSPSGNHLLYSVYSTANDLKPNLWIINAQGNGIGANRKNLELETWARKCVFADELNLYCAVPQQLQAGAGLFSELAESAADNLYKINTRTGVKKIIAIPEKNLNISNLMISRDDSHLYFTDNKTKKLYKIKLK